MVRLSQIHDLNKQRLITFMVTLAREKGVSAYVGDGKNRWSAAHVSDTARLYRLALEKGLPDRYHSVAEEGVPLRDIAEIIGRRLKLPVVAKTPAEAADHFGRVRSLRRSRWSRFKRVDARAARMAPGWPGLIADLERAHNLEI
jgi:nucleoside-diphosphate-sugar epimerase